MYVIETEIMYFVFDRDANPYASDRTIIKNIQQKEKLYLDNKCSKGYKLITVVRKGLIEMPIIYYWKKQVIQES